MYKAIFKVIPRLCRGVACVSLLCSVSPVYGDSEAEQFHLDSPRNRGVLRIDLNNDVVFAKDSQFSNGFSLEYHGVRYATWEDSRAPSVVKWVGKNFPTLGDEDAVVSFRQGVGQNIITPGAIELEIPPAGDIPYAGTLTYSLAWQSFNRNKGAALQATMGILGEEAMAKPVQKFVHNDLGAGEDPKGWDTQRDSEPILNFSYQYLRRLGHLGMFNNGWASQGEIAHGVFLGNLLTGAELVATLRCGWNIPEGFAGEAAPPGGGLHIPKPATASAHGVEVTLSARAHGLFYSVLYDGSLLTNDKRDVERVDYVFGGGVGINYYHYDRFAVRLLFNVSTDLIRDELLPEPVQGYAKTDASPSYGSILIEFPF